MRYKSPAELKAKIASLETQLNARHKIIEAALLYAILSSAHEQQVAPKFPEKFREKLKDKADVLVLKAWAEAERVLRARGNEAHAPITIRRKMREMVYLYFDRVVAKELDGVHDYLVNEALSMANRQEAELNAEPDMATIFRVIMGPLLKAG